ncbi:hypothetical protein SDC9_156008 [bioreactor metagenome]|uniref:Uncharacterized protein n=1 Tax=bioreactor metagenome TaxID=1076179 RepID=A0A645F8B3_9ZZZZ
MKNRDKVLFSGANGDILIPVLFEEGKMINYTAQTIVPIIAEGDAIGAVMLLSKENGVKMSLPELKVLEIAAGFMGKQMEQ